MLTFGTDMAEPGAPGMKAVDCWKDPCRDAEDCEVVTEPLRGVDIEVGGCTFDPDAATCVTGGVECTESKAGSGGRCPIALSASVPCFYVKVPYRPKAED